MPLLASRHQHTRCSKSGHNLVPPPNFHMVRYFGVLASHHHLRPRVVPGPGAELPGQQLSLDLAGRDGPEGQPESKAPRRIGWASLLARVFAFDVTVCRKCGGRMRILEVVDTPDAIARVLHGARHDEQKPRPSRKGHQTLIAAVAARRPHEGLLLEHGGARAQASGKAAASMSARGAKRGSRASARRSWAKMEAAAARSLTAEAWSPAERCARPSWKRAAASSLATTAFVGSCAWQVVFWLSRFGTSPGLV